MNVKIDDRAFRALMERLPADDAHVKAGVLGSKGGGAREEGSDASVADIALIHEFGTDEVAERSFIRRTMLEKEREIAQLQADLARQIVEGNLTSERALDILGAFAAGEIKKTIAEGPHIPPPLAKSTVERKGSSRPLVDTGQLVGTINHEVST